MRRSRACHTACQLRLWICRRCSAWRWLQNYPFQISTCKFDSIPWAQWQQALFKLADQQSLHGLLAGRACRLLLDAQALTVAAAAQRLNLALSAANEPAQAGAWREGFLQGGGLLLLYDEALWQVLDDCLERAAAIVNAGVQFMTLLALNDDGAPSYVTSPPRHSLNSESILRLHARPLS